MSCGLILYIQDGEEKKAVEVPPDATIADVAEQAGISTSSHLLFDGRRFPASSKEPLADIGVGQQVTLGVLREEWRWEEGAKVVDDHGAAVFETVKVRYSITRVNRAINLGEHVKIRFTILKTNKKVHSFGFVNPQLPASCETEWIQSRKDGAFFPEGLRRIGPDGSWCEIEVDPSGNLLTWTIWRSSDGGGEGETGTHTIQVTSFWPCAPTVCTHNKSNSNFLVDPTL
eukprot:Hpha_TRINITY_DN15359_c2_g1::TRINITY_DN15359_c2_g1_i1::g.88211::m.88211